MIFADILIKKASVRDDRYLFYISKYDAEDVKEDTEDHARKIDDGSDRQIFPHILMDAEKDEQTHARACKKSCHHGACADHAFHEKRR